MSERSFDALLCDVDGVVRRWDTGAVAALERKHGVPEGTVLAIAFKDELLRPALTGEVSDDEWRRNVAVELLPTYGVEVAADLVAGWSESVGAVDEDVLAVLAELRAGGVRVGLVSNATTRLESDLDALGLADGVDAVVSSARLGTTKPEPALYFAAAQLVGTDVERCLFVDDTAVNVEVARAVGMQAHLYEGVTGLRVAVGLDDAGERDHETDTSDN